MDIKIIGRGGQGAVSAAYLIASSAFHEGYYSQASVMFGIERQGSPVNAYCRIDKRQINRYDSIKEPDIIIILDQTLLNLNPDKDLKSNGLLIINTSKKSEELNLRKDIIVKTINASSIALKIFKRPFYNTPMIGAFAGLTGLVSIKSVYQSIIDTFEKKGSEVIELNKSAAEEAYKTYSKEGVKVKL